METSWVFVVGMVGALAPEIVRLYALRTKGESITAFYLLVSLAFAALGGFIAVILPSTTYWGAFYAGISAPIVVSTAAKKGLGPRPSTPKGPALKGSPLRDTAPAPGTPARPSLLKFVNAL